MSTLNALASEYGIENVFFAWVGQNATCGTPHPQTGELSMWGKYYAFSSKADRDEWVTNYYDPNGYEKAYVCTVNTGRRFSLGCSQRHYVEELALVSQHRIW